MTSLTGLGRGIQALILGVVVVGCATAATITGHLSGGDLLTVLTTTGGIAGGVTAAHVGGATAANAMSAGLAATGPAPAAGAGSAAVDAVGASPSAGPTAAVDTLAPVPPATTPGPAVTS